MTRIRLAAAFTLMLSGLAFTSASHAQAPAAPPAARFYYTQGYNGLGYYAYPAAPATPAYSGRYYYAAPSLSRSWGHYGGSAPSAYREPGTGRNLLLAKPWLKPLQ